MRKILAFVTTALCTIAMKQFCYKQTDGFALYKILSSLCFNPAWEVQQPSPPDLFDQPFHYLAKGAQSYVFASEDGNTVIKFFRLNHLQPPKWLTLFALPIPLQPYKVNKWIEKRAELTKDFLSYKIAFEELQEETGLIYLHLNKTKHLNKKLKIYDKIKIAHEIDLDNMEFLVQKRATLVYPTIDTLVKTEGPEAAKEAINDLVNLLLSRCQKGIFDKDPDLNTNFGFLHRRPVQIDIGRFTRELEIKNKAAHRDEIIRITDHFRQWLEAYHPDLSESLAQSINNIAAAS